jgi:glucosamine--fructose-6-phosphate aminotransferase (isomerizing)
LNALMLREIRDQPRLLREELPRLRAEARAAAGPLAAVTRRLVVTGCGDSYIAGVALEQAARALLGGDRPVHVVRSFEAANYFPLCEHDLVVACSVSGEVARTLEAVEQARKAGARTAALVARPTSALGRCAEAVLRLPEPIARNTPHSRDYLATLLALAALFEGLSETHVRALDHLGDTVEEHLAGWEATAHRLVQTLAVAEKLFVLGSGPSWGSALYGAAKYWEGGGILAFAHEIEEFGHGAHLLVKSGDAAIVIAPAGAGARHASAILGSLRRLGLRVLVLGAQDQPPKGVEVIPLPDVEDVWSPFVSAVPLQLLCYELANVRGLDVTRPLGGRPGGDTFQAVHDEWTLQKSV